MKHFIIVESNTTGTGAIVVQRLLDRGYRVTFLTRERGKYPFLAQPHPLLRVREIDTNSLASLLETVNDIKDREGVDAIFTSSEFYVPTVAQLAGSLGLRGLDPVAAQICRHKPSTRKALRLAGLLTPDFKVITTEKEAWQIASEIIYPCVVKPPSDSSSHGVRLVYDPLEFMEHFRDIHNWKQNVRGQVLDGSVLVESALTGPEYSVETFTVPNGATHVIGVTNKHLSQEPYFVETGHDFPWAGPESSKQALIETVLCGLKAVGFNFGPAHTEIRMTPRGPVIVEINPRLAGGMIPELVCYATGLDLLQLWMDLLLGNPVDFTPRTKKFASIRFLTSDCAGQITRVSGIEEARRIPGIYEVSVNRKPGDVVKAATDAYDRMGQVIACADDYQQVNRILALAAEKIRIEVEPIACEVAV
jgi:cysteine synthase A